MFSGCDFEAGALTGFLEVGSDCRPKQIGHVPDLDVAHLFSGAFEDSLRIRQFASTKETKIDVILHDADVANTILHLMAGTVTERNDVHFENVLVAWRHLFDYQLAQRKRKFLDSPAVKFQ